MFNQAIRCQEFVRNLMNLETLGKGVYIYDSHLKL